MINLIILYHKIITCFGPDQALTDLVAESIYIHEKKYYIYKENLVGESTFASANEATSVMREYREARKTWMS